MEECWRTIGSQSMNDQLNQSGQLSNSQDGCQTNSRRYDSFTTRPVRLAIPSNSWASCSFWGQTRGPKNQVISGHMFKPSSIFGWWIHEMAGLTLGGWWIYLSPICCTKHQATGYASQHNWCLSQARINWEGCVRKGIRRKMVGW